MHLTYSFTAILSTHPVSTNHASLAYTCNLALLCQSRLWHRCAEVAQSTLRLLTLLQDDFRDMLEGLKEIVAKHNNGRIMDVVQKAVDDAKIKRRPSLINSTPPPVKSEAVASGGGGGGGCCTVS